jgi:hypothetical protein
VAPLAASAISLASRIRRRSSRKVKRSCDVAP